ncbi:NAD(P)-binding protein [Martensiomyces pterosporus]|nr:NAD(P)-binding protein [Martensiomyces pterosporus]
MSQAGIKSVAGSVAIVTGASKGIGRAISFALLQRGVSVVGFARSAELLASIASESQSVATQGAQFIACAGDMTKDSDLDKAVELVRNTGLPLAALINNAGVLEPIQKLADAPVDEWKRHFDVNLFSIVALTQRALPLLRESEGRIINVSSGAASHAYHGWAAYCASKAALNMLTESISVEEPRITALAIRPGVVDTDMQAKIRAEGDQGMLPDELAKFHDLHTTGTLLPPEKPAHVIVRLALEATKDLSGKYYSWNAAEISQYAS